MSVYTKERTFVPIVVTVYRSGGYQGYIHVAGTYVHTCVLPKFVVDGRIYSPPMRTMYISTPPYI